MTANLKSRLARLEAKHGVDDSPLIFCLADWAEGCPRAFQPWEEEESLPRFKAIALVNLVAAGKIEEADRERVIFMVRVLAYPPEREDEDERYARVRPLLRQWEERQAAAKATQGEQAPHQCPGTVQ
jgi:hypothetical protein